MHDSESAIPCPEPGAAAVFGGCPGRPSDEAPIGLGSFQCSHVQCPVLARLRPAQRKFAPSTSGQVAAARSAEIIDIALHRVLLKGPRA